jgi:hypothetical protein
MTKEYIKELCDEKHENIDKMCADLFKKQELLHSCLSSKFNQILGWVIVTLLSVVGSMIAIIVSRPKL